MAKKIIENISMGKAWNAYIASAEGILRNAGLWDDESWMLMGMTGMAFHFIIHKDACISSVTVYDWNNEHFQMMDRIGVHTDNYAFDDDRYNTIEHQRSAAVKRIKESIDKGIAVVNWAPSGMLEFGIIHGYDDDDGVFFIKDWSPRNVDPLLYENLGKSDVSILYYQIFNGKTDINKDTIYRQSLVYGVQQWGKDNHFNPDYACGRKGYENLINYLSHEKEAGDGLAYIITSYADSKKCIADYLNHIAGASIQLDGIDKSAQLFKSIADKYSILANLFPFISPFMPDGGETYKKSSANLPEMLKLAKECLKLEEEAMGIMKRSLE